MPERADRRRRAAAAFASSLVVAIALASCSSSSSSAFVPPPMPATSPSPSPGVSSTSFPCPFISDAKIALPQIQALRRSWGSGFSPGLANFAATHHLDGVRIFRLSGGKLSPVAMSFKTASPTADFKAKELKPSDFDVELARYTPEEIPSLAVIVKNPSNGPLVYEMYYVFAGNHAKSIDGIKALKRVPATGLHEWSSC